MNSRGHIWLLLSLLVLAIGAFVIWPRADADRFGGPTLTVRGVDWIAGNDVRDETDGSWRLQADLAFAGPTNKFTLNDNYLQAICGMMLYEANRDQRPPQSRKDVHRVDLNFVANDSTLYDIKLKFDHHLPMQVIDGQCQPPQEGELYFPTFGPRLGDWYFRGGFVTREDDQLVAKVEFRKPAGSEQSVWKFDHLYACQSVLQDPIIRNFEMGEPCEGLRIADSKNVEITATAGKPDGIITFSASTSETFQVAGDLCVLAAESEDG